MKGLDLGSKNMLFVLSLALVHIDIGPPHSHDVRLFQEKIHLKLLLLFSIPVFLSAMILPTLRDSFLVLCVVVRDRKKLQFLSRLQSD